MKTYRVGFILEQALGHITHSRNLQATVPSDSAVRAHWGFVDWETAGLPARIPIYRTNWTVRAGIRARRALADIARQAQLDVLFFHTQVPAIFATDWIKRIPSVISLDATPIQYDSLGQFYQHKSGPAWLERVKWRMHSNCFRAARGLVTWSEWAKRSLVNDYQAPEDKVTVIPPGVNVSEWTRPAPRTRHERPAKLLFVGGDLQRKGGLLLLDAFRAMRSLGLELHLVTRDRLPAEPGLFVYNDMQPNSDALKQLYHACDLFCLPTYGDCLPMVLSEAGAAGLPTVSTRVAGIPEIVKDGETGFLVPAGDGPALTEALRRLALDADLRVRMGARAVELTAQEFDARRNTGRLLDLLKQTADAAGIESKVA